MYICTQCTCMYMYVVKCTLSYIFSYKFESKLCQCMCQNVAVITLVPSGSSTNSLGSTKTLPDILSFLQWEPTHRNACMLFTVFICNSHEMKKVVNSCMLFIVFICNSHDMRKVVKACMLFIVFICNSHEMRKVVKL